MNHVPLLTLMVLTPALGAISLRWIPYTHRARRVAVFTAFSTLLLTLVAVASFDLGTQGMQLEDTAFTVPGLMMRWHLGIDGLSVVLLPLAALIGVVTVLGLPQHTMSRSHLASALGMVSATLGIITSLDMGWLAFFWLVRLVPGAALIARHGDPTLRTHLARTWGIFLIGGSVPLLVAVALLGIIGHRAGLAAPLDLTALTTIGIPRDWQMVLFPLFVVAVGMRMAIVPFHGWMGVIVEHGPPGVAMMLAGAHVALYLIARVGLPLLPEASAVGMAPLMFAALGCALYGSLVALAQDDLRRMVGYLVVSHAGLMAGGIASMNTQSVSGAVLQSVASGLAMTGLLLVIAALHARTGTARMGDFGGLARRSPRMTVFFLLFGLAAVGFPGTLTFVSEDLLLHGVLDNHPIVAVLLLLATAINGITVIRAFFRTFMGPPAVHGSSVVTSAPIDDLVPRERAVAFLLTTSIFLGGIFPRPLIEARVSVVESLITYDAHHALRARHDANTSSHTAEH